MSDDYAPLWDQLNAAAEQAIHGKGKERHANGKPWTDQVMVRNTMLFGIGAPLAQVNKKVEEAYHMHLRGQDDAARAELLGAINYIAAACHVLGDVRRAPDERG